MDRRRFPLPTFTNREDCVLSVNATDDDTGQPLNLGGITLGPGFSNGFTGSGNWNVTVGSIGTISPTLLTIPGYPIGNQLLAVSLVVSPGLAITSGMQILIADPTGANTMNGYVTSYNAATGALVCQVGWSFQFEIRSRGPNETGAGYATWFDFGVQADVGPLLAASLGNGLYITDLGFIQITIPENQFKKLAGGTYIASCSMTDTVNTRQLFVAPLPVIPGGVTA